MPWKPNFRIQQGRSDLIALLIAHLNRAKEEKFAFANKPKKFWSTKGGMLDVCNRKTNQRGLLGRFGGGSERSVQEISLPSFSEIDTGCKQRTMVNNGGQRIKVGIAWSDLIGLLIRLPAS